jgi:AraC-like DNA-binding protein
MMVHYDESTTLARLDVAIRLKADLVHKLAALPPARWAAQVVRFVSALERSGVNDATALVVLLAELCEELRVMIGVSEFAKPSELTQLERAVVTSWTRLPPAVLLAKFKDHIVRALPIAPSGVSLSSLTQQTKTMIDERYAESLTLDDLAAAAGRSKRYVGTLFREEMGVTAHDYLTRVRLRRALDLIRQGEKIEVVSLLVGYRSKANFYRHFRTHLGITPLAYRAALANSTAFAKRHSGSD